MVPEIGIVLSLYILSRLVFSYSMGRPRQILHAVLSALAGVVAVLVVCDLTVRGFTETSLPDVLWHRGKAPAAAAVQPKASPPAFRLSKADAGGFEMNFPYLGKRKLADTTLHREWVALHDPSLPIELAETPGVALGYKSESYSGKFQWHAKYQIVAKQPVTALDISFVLLDIWGERLQTLRDETIRDIPANVPTELESVWDMYPEENAVRFYTSIAFVRGVRLGDGRIIKADIDSVVQQIRKFSEKFDPAELQPLTPGTPGARESKS
jgi:hypothetical protein